MFHTWHFPRKTPSEEHVSAQGIADYIKAVTGSTRMDIHSLMILRHGNVIFEKAWAPYELNAPHMMFSASKSFTSTAIGIAWDEGLLDLHDPVQKYLGEEMRENPDEHLKKLTLWHLLTMTAGHSEDPVYEMMVTKKDWIRRYFSLPFSTDCGEIFLYDSGATYLLSCIITKITGQKLVEYLTPRLFEPLGIADVFWDESPDGYNLGGWGLYIDVEAMAKLGQLYLNGGIWQGKRIISQAYIDMATSKQVETMPAAAPKEALQFDNMHGYGFQFWRNRVEGYRADGAYGQFIFVLPEKDAVIVTTQGTLNPKRSSEHIWECLYPAFDAPVSPGMDMLVRDKKPTYPIPCYAPQLEMRAIWGEYACEENYMGLSRVRIEKAENVVAITLIDARGEHPFCAGIERWAGFTADIQDHAPISILGRTVAPVPAAGAAWWEEDKLVVNWRYLTTPYSDLIDFVCSEEGITITFHTNIRVMQPQICDKRGTITAKRIKNA